MVRYWANILSQIGGRDIRPETGKSAVGSGAAYDKVRLISKLAIETGKQHWVGTVGLQLEVVFEWKACRGIGTRNRRSVNVVGSGHRGSLVILGLVHVTIVQSDPVRSLRHGYLKLERLPDR